MATTEGADVADQDRRPATAAHDVRQDMELLAVRHLPQEFDRIWLPDLQTILPLVPPSNEG
jgi:hypothetical protein